MPQFLLVSLWIYRLIGHFHRKKAIILCSSVSLKSVAIFSKTVCTMGNLDCYQKIFYLVSFWWNYLTRGKNMTFWQKILVKKLGVWKLCHDFWPRNEKFSEYLEAVFVFSKKCYSFWNKLQFLWNTVTLLPSFIIFFGYFCSQNTSFCPVFVKKESFSGGGSPEKRHDNIHN